MCISAVHHLMKTVNFAAFLTDIAILTSRALYVLLSLHPKTAFIFFSVLKRSEGFFKGLICPPYHPVMTS
jgi:hypothetical protein